MKGVLKCLEGVKICLEVVCNVLKGILKVSEGFPSIFPFNVVRCPHPYCSPINKVCAVSPPPSLFLLPTLIVPSIKKVCVVSPHPSILFFCGVSPHPPCSSVPLPHLDRSWILSQVEKVPACKMKPRIGFFVHFACACVC